MQEATARNPSWLRVILALIVAPAVPTLPLLVFTLFAAPLVIFNYGLCWIFFAPMYLLLRRHLAMSIGTVLAMGVAAGLLASLVRIASVEAIDIYLSAYSAAIKIAAQAFATPATAILTIPPAVTAFVFWLITGPVRNEAFDVHGFPAPAGTSRAVGRNRALRGLALVYLCLPLTVYWWTLHNYWAAEAADDGIIKLVGRDMTPAANPIVIELPPGLRYQARDGGQWKDRTSGKIDLRTFYPNFSSPRDPENVARGFLHECVGYCEGEIRVAISNIAADLADGKASSKADVEANTILRLHLSSIAGVENRFWLKSVDGNSGYDLTARCFTEFRRPECRLYFSLVCNPAIGVEVNGWYYERLDEAMEVRRRVDAFVSSMVKEPKCGT